MPKASCSAVLVRLAAMFALAVAIPAHSESSYIEAVGAVEASDCNARTVMVLGIKFAAMDAGSLVAVCGERSNSGLQYVSIKGHIESSGSISLIKIVSLSVGQYVPGSTPVYLSGPISGSRNEFGTIEVSGALIVSASEDSVFQRVIEAVGTQPLLGGVILPTTIRLLAKVEPQNTGANIESVIGSGVSANSVIGSGASIKSVIGSGVSANSVIGSGASANSVIGSGVSANSAIGSDASANSVIGSGVSANMVAG